MEFSVVTTAITNLGTLMNTALDVISGNALLIVLFCVPALTAGFYVIKKAVKAARA